MNYKRSKTFTIFFWLDARYSIRINKIFKVRFIKFLFVIVVDVCYTSVCCTIGSINKKNIPTRVSVCQWGLLVFSFSIFIPQTISSFNLQFYFHFFVYSDEVSFVVSFIRSFIACHYGKELFVLFVRLFNLGWHFFFSCILSILIYEFFIVEFAFRIKRFNSFSF